MWNKKNEAKRRESFLHIQHWLTSMYAQRQSIEGTTTHAHKMQFFFHRTPHCQSRNNPFA